MELLLILLIISEINLWILISRICKQLDKDFLKLSKQINKKIFDSRGNIKNIKQQNNKKNNN